MPKIPKVTRWSRFVAFLRGILLYNTIYWSRASDGLRPPRPTREERRQKRPVRDLTIIKPREKPRAKLETDPSAPATVIRTFIEPTASAAAGAAPGNGEVIRRRKRRKNHHARLSPMDAFAMSSSGVLSKIFGRKG